MIMLSFGQQFSVKKTKGRILIQIQTRNTVSHFIITNVQQQKSRNRIQDQNP